MYYIIFTIFYICIHIVYNFGEYWRFKEMAHMRSMKGWIPLHCRVSEARQGRSLHNGKLYKNLEKICAMYICILLNYRTYAMCICMICIYVYIRCILLEDIQYIFFIVLNLNTSIYSTHYYSMQHTR